MLDFFKKEKKKEKGPFSPKCVFINLCIYMYDSLITALKNFQTSTSTFSSPNVKHKDKFVSFGMCMMRFFK